MSWSLGFSIIAGSVVIAIVIFLIGIPKYRKQVPVGSPLTRVAQVIVAALKKWRLSSTRHHYGLCYEEEDEHKSESTNSNQIYLLARTNQFRYLLSISIHLFISPLSNYIHLYHLNFNKCKKIDISKVVQHAGFMGTSYAS